MTSYRATLVERSEARTLVEIGFGEPADNDRIVRDALEAIAALSLEGGRLLCFNGRASLPAAMAICHAVAHLYAYVACFDPKLAKYVVVTAHGPEYRPGDLLES